MRQRNFICDYVRRGRGDEGKEGLVCKSSLESKPTMGKDEGSKTRDEGTVLRRPRDKDRAERECLGELASTGPQHQVGRIVLRAKGDELGVVASVHLRHARVSAGIVCTQTDKIVVLRMYGVCGA